MSQKFEVASSDFYSNCLIEAIRAKIKNPNVKITVAMPWYNEVFCPHVMWSDGVADYDFGYDGPGGKNIKNWTIHAGHIRKRPLGYNDRYIETAKKWANRKHGVEEEHGQSGKPRNSVSDASAKEV